MDAGTIGVLIPIFGIATGMLAIWTSHQRKMAQIRLKSSSDHSAQFAAANAELEQRVRVLERIVTDKGFDVAGQIEALRDARKIEAQLDRTEKQIG